MRIWTFLGFLTALSGSTIACGSEISKCSLPTEALRFYSIADLPEAIRADFLKRIRGSIAAPGERFNETDEIEAGLPMRRLIEIDRLKDRWVILYAVGGFAPISRVVGYRMIQPTNDAEVLASIDERSYAELCRDRVSLLYDDGKFTPRIEGYW